MKLTKQNVLRFIKEHGGCINGVRQLKRLFRQKKSMEYVFNRVQKMDIGTAEWGYVDWMFTQLYEGHNYDYACLRRPHTFRNFKALFEMLPENK